MQFSLDLPAAAIAAFVAACAARGVFIKWFGAGDPRGFTSVWQHWRYFDQPQRLPNAERVLGSLCDMRLPLTLTQPDCLAIADVIRASIAGAQSRAPG